MAKEPTKGEGAAPRRVRRRRAARLPDELLAEQPSPLAPAVDLEDVRRRLVAAAGQVKGTFAERDDAVLAMLLAWLTGLNYLFIGDPGTGKTAMVNALSKHVTGARCFAPGTLNTFTTLNDLIGRIDLAALQRGEERRHTDGKLLECEIAFLDEVMKATGVINTLLGPLNERKFDGKPIPLWSCGSATNWPEVRARAAIVEALFDRWHIKCVVERVRTRDSRRVVLQATRELAAYTPKDGTTVTFAELKLASQAIKGVAIEQDVETMLCSVAERLAKDKVEISDRRAGQMQFVLQASAWLRGSNHVTADDFDQLVWMCWVNEEDIPKAKAIVESCDLELSQHLIREIDKCRERYQDLRRSRGRPETAGKLVDDIIAVAKHVTAALKGSALREKSQDDVRTALQELKNDFDVLFSEWKDKLPKKAEKDGEG